MDLNFQYTAFEKCLKSTFGLSETTYHNLCDGSVTAVANGFWDYVTAVGITGIILGVAAISIGFAFSLFVGE